MTNALLGYMIGKYYADTAHYADLNELFLKGFSLNDFRTPEVERFLEIQQLIAQQDVINTQTLEVLSCLLEKHLACLPEEELPFYILPLAYLPEASLEQVLRMTADLLIVLKVNQRTIEQVLCMIGVIKWSLITQTSYISFVSRCFPTMKDVDSSLVNLVGEALLAHADAITTNKTCLESIGQTALKNACFADTATCGNDKQVAMRCALVYALLEIDTSTTDYKLPDVLGNKAFSAAFPLKPRLTSHVDAHIIDGYYRLDGYIAWKMRPKNESLLAVAILGDTYGPDREMLRFWNFCNKHLNWEQLTNDLDDFYRTEFTSDFDWRSQLNGPKIQWDRHRVAFIMGENRCVSFIPNYKKKTFVLDHLEAKHISKQKFEFGPPPGFSVW